MVLANGYALLAIALEPSAPADAPAEIRAEMERAGADVTESAAIIGGIAIACGATLVAGGIALVRRRDAGRRASALVLGGYLAVLATWAAAPLWSEDARAGTSAAHAIGVRGGVAVVIGALVALLLSKLLARSLRRQLR